MDNSKMVFKISHSNPPVSIIKKLLIRFKNLRELVIKENVKIRLKKEFFEGVKLNKLRKLDISLCKLSDEKTISKFIARCQNVQYIKLPYNTIQYSNLLDIKRWLKNSLLGISLKLNENLPNQSKNTGVIKTFFLKYFYKNPHIEELNFYTFDAAIFQKLAE